MKFGTISSQSNEKEQLLTQTKFRWLIRSQLYLITNILDIMFHVCLCARYQSIAKESHYKFVKRIVKYLNGTIIVGSWYLIDVSCTLVGFSNFDFRGCKLDKKSIIATCMIES